MASIKLPTLSNFPSIDFSKLEMPQLPSFDPEAFATAAKDAAKDVGYITVGLGVMTFQQAQVRRREFVKSLNDQFGTGKAQIDEMVDAIEARLATFDTQFVAFEDKLDVAVENLEKRLPEQAGSLLNTAHESAKSARKQVRNLIVSAT